MIYSNPVWPGYFADPFVLQYEGAYYAYGTGGPDDHGRQGDGRMFPLLRSADLVHWEYVGGALEPLNDAAKPAYWAPAVAARGSSFYLYYSAGGFEGQGHQLRVATADEPTGPFRDAGRVILPHEPFSIDAEPFIDPRDGCAFLFFAKDFLDGERPGTGLVAVELAPDMATPVGPVTTILRPSADWQVFERNRFWYGRTWPAWYTVEGPHLRYHDGRYYCFYSGGCWDSAHYGVAYGVADHPLGPYRDAGTAGGPLVLRSVPGRVPGPGHNTSARTPGGAEVLVYHAWNEEKTVRRICIDPLVWTAEGPRCEGPTTGPQELDGAA